ncbi:MAG: glycerol-3-phosphate dehydrogenase/oxidase [Deltaproteobacteria bacterium]|nr:MAG: glycerol-3-phosphate dehydrogenase/oxidase [Deltaproteobacteria bacterium]
MAGELELKSESRLPQINDHYDVVIVGAGITGAGIFRDLALHGLKVLIIDKKDFSSQTSQSSSKMLHGGIRYLENFDFALVWEALHEKNFWIKRAPHLCYEDSFYLPIFKNSARPLWMVKIGLWLYDFLSSFKNSPHRILDREQTLNQIPGLKSKGLSGAGVYYDAVMDDVKITLEVLYDGLQEKGCEALNYVSMTSFENNGDTNTLSLRDEITGDTKTVTCRETVFATGPFTDRLMAELGSIPWTPKLLPSKGSHLWLKKEKIGINHPMVLNDKDGRVIFVIPHEEATLVGTTEVSSDSDFFDMKISDGEIDYLLKHLNDYFPSANISKDDIISSFAGIRPLVMEGDSSDKGKTSRVHKTFQPYHNLHVILGGKYTTFRVMGQDISRSICSTFKISYNSSLSMSALRKRSIVSAFQERRRVLSRERVERIIKEEYVRTKDDLMTRRLGLQNTGGWKFEPSLDQFLSDYKDLLEELQ